MQHTSSLIFPKYDIDQRALVYVSAFALWLLVGVRTSTTYLLFRSDPKLGTAVIIASSCAMLCFVLLLAVAVGARKENPAWPYAAKLIFLYVSYLGISLFWTQASSLSHAVAYWLGLAAEVLAMTLLLKVGDPDRVAVAALKGFVCASVIVAVIAWAAPGTDEHRMGDAEFLHPNAIGYEFGLAGLFSIYLAHRYRKQRQWKWIAVALVFSLLRSLSKASILSFVVAAAYYVFWRSGLRTRARLKIVVLALGLFAVSWTFIEPYLDEYTSGTNVETLTGRTIIWGVSYDIASERPWLGHGFYSYRSVVPYFGEFEAWHAHNELLQQFFSYGLVGVAVVAAIYFSLHRLLRKSLKSPQYALACSLLIYGLLHGITEADDFEMMLPVRLILLLSMWVVATRDGGSSAGVAPFGYALKSDSTV